MPSHSSARRGAFHHRRPPRSTFARTLGVRCLGALCALQLAAALRPNRVKVKDPPALTVSSLSQWLASTSYRGALPPEYLQANTEYALRARTHVPAVGQVPIELFLRWVLPPQHLDEPVNDWRTPFFDKLFPHVRNCSSVREVAETVIPLAFTELGNTVEFRPNNTPGIMAPINETLATGYASCTGLSILVADALRAVGVPARVVGTPEWNRPEGGNHNWVEVWTGEDWHFLDAAPVTKVTWDDAWFAPGHDSATAVRGSIHGIYTAVWDENDADSNYTITWREPHTAMPAIELTQKYLDLARNAGSAALPRARPAAGALAAALCAVCGLAL